MTTPLQQFMSQLLEDYDGDFNLVVDNAKMMTIVDDGGRTPATTPLSLSPPVSNHSTTRWEGVESSSSTTSLSAVVVVSDSTTTRKQLLPTLQRRQPIIGFCNKNTNTPAAPIRQESLETEEEDGSNGFSIQPSLLFPHQDGNKNNLFRVPRHSQQLDEAAATAAGRPPLKPLKEAKKNIVWGSATSASNNKNHAASTKKWVVQKGKPTLSKIGPTSPIKQTKKRYSPPRQEKHLAQMLTETLVISSPMATATDNLSPRSPAIVEPDDYHRVATLGISYPRKKPMLSGCLVDFSLAEEEESSAVGEEEDQVSPRGISYPRKKNLFTTDKLPPEAFVNTSPIQDEDSQENRVSPLGLLARGLSKTLFGYENKNDPANQQAPVLPQRRPTITPPSRPKLGIMDMMKLSEASSSNSTAAMSSSSIGSRSTPSTKSILGTIDDLRVLPPPLACSSPPAAPAEVAGGRKRPIIFRKMAKRR